MDWLTGWLRQPLVQFFLLGAIIYSANYVTGGADDAPSEAIIVVTSERVASLAEAWQKTRQRPPVAEELQVLIDAYVREEMLYREALAMGLDQDDSLIRRRLAQKLEFLVSDLSELAEPTDAELETFYRENPDKFSLPARLSFEQLYFSADRQGGMNAATRALEELRTGRPVGQLTDAGDPFMLPQSFADVSEVYVARQFGQTFADELLKLEPGRWLGPIESGYGLHLIYIAELQAAAMPPLAEVRDDVLNEWQFRRAAEINEQFIERIAESYEVRVEEPVSNVSEPAAAGMVR